MSPSAALLDANVLYSAPMRDLLIQLAIMEVFSAKWSTDIQREWIEALLRNQPRRDRTALERTRNLMEAALEDALVTGYESLIPTLLLPDMGDRHVLAAAIVGRCDVIVTRNLNDFPAKSLAPFKITAQHPDEFLINHLNVAPGVFCAAVRKVRTRLRNPPVSVEDYLDTLARQGLVATVAELNPFTRLL